MEPDASGTKPGEACKSHASAVGAESGARKSRLPGTALPQPKAHCAWPDEAQTSPRGAPLAGVRPSGSQVLPVHRTGSGIDTDQIGRCPITGLGVGLAATGADVVPLPSCPRSLRPQQYARSSVVTAQVWY
jgi:hypothetical protein